MKFLLNVRKGGNPCEIVSGPNPCGGGDPCLPDGTSVDGLPHYDPATGLYVCGPGYAIGNCVTNRYGQAVKNCRIQQNYYPGQTQSSIFLEALGGVFKDPGSPLPPSGFGVGEDRFVGNWYGDTPTVRADIEGDYCIALVSRDPFLNGGSTRNEGYQINIEYRTFLQMGYVVSSAFYPLGDPSYYSGETITIDWATQGNIANPAKYRYFHVSEFPTPPLIPGASPAAQIKIQARVTGWAAPPRAPELPEPPPFAGGYGLCGCQIGSTWPIPMNPAILNPP